MKASLTFEDESDYWDETLGAQFEEREIPEEMLSQCAAMRSLKNAAELPKLTDKIWKGFASQD